MKHCWACGRAGNCPATCPDPACLMPTCVHHRECDTTRRQYRRPTHEET